jgi:hypothetical protein
MSSPGKLGRRKRYGISMDKKTCDTCVFWKPKPEGMLVELPPYGAGLSTVPVGSCESPKMILGYRIMCITEIFEDLAFIGSDEGWGMYTRPKFGCVHHKSKEKE